MIIESNNGIAKNCNLIIKNYPNLEKIIVKRGQLQELNTFKICNCEKLKTIETEKDSFWLVKNLILESNCIQFYFSIHLPNLQSFKTGGHSFEETTSLSLISIIYDYHFIITSSHVKSSIFWKEFSFRLFYSHKKYLLLLLFKLH